MEARSTGAATRREAPRARGLARRLARPCAAWVAGLALSGLAAAQHQIRPLVGQELAALELSDGLRLDLELPERLSAPLEIALPIAGAWQRVELEPTSVRAPGFQLLVPAADGSLRATEPPPPATVLGRVPGSPGSLAAGSLVDGQLHLLLRLEAGGPLWVVEPLPEGGHAVYARTSAVGSAGTCGTLTPFGWQTPPGSQAAVIPGDDLHLAEIALEADYEYYQLLSSSEANVVNDLEKIINQVRLIYVNEVAITYEVTSITVRTTPNDPYTVTDAIALLDQMRTAWNQLPLSAIPRDVAHLFTGRDMNGSVAGIAYLDVLCNKALAYGIAQSRITNNLAQRVSITAHELGHNWSAPHCDGDPDCAIMCAVIAACPGTLQEFGTRSTNAITTKKLNSTCLSIEVVPGLPTLVEAVPRFGPSTGGGVLELHGAYLPTDGLPAVTIGGAPAEVLSASDTLVTLVVPPGPGGTTVDVVLEGGVATTTLEKGYRYELAIHPGDSVSSSFTPLEIERFYIQGLAGARFGARLIPLDVSQGLIAGLRLVGPNEQVLTFAEGSVQKPGLQVTLPDFVFTQTGEHRLEVYAIGITQGGYQIKTKGKPVKASSGIVSVSSAAPLPEFGFSAAEGTLLKLVQYKSLPPKGAFALVDGEPAALLPALLALVGPEGPVALDGLIETTPALNLQRVKNLVLPDTGAYTLQLGGLDGSIGHGKVSVKLKPPKVAKQAYVLEP